MYFVRYVEVCSVANACAEESALDLSDLAGQDLLVKTLEFCLSAGYPALCIAPVALPYSTDLFVS